MLQRRIERAGSAAGRTGVAALVVLVACRAAAPAPAPETDSKTFWLRPCANTTECGSELLCSDGYCTATCTGDGDCTRSGEAVCMQAAGEMRVCMHGCVRDSDCSGDGARCEQAVCTRNAPPAPSEQPSSLQSSDAAVSPEADVGPAEPQAGSSGGAACIPFGQTCFTGACCEPLRCVQDAYTRWCRY